MTRVWLGSLCLCASATTAPAQSNYEPYSFTTLAGVAPSTDSGAYCSGSVANFRSPSGVAVDDAGNVYVGDARLNTIRKISPSGAVSILAGLPGYTVLDPFSPSRGSLDGPACSARFYGPSGVAVDGTGNVYVADTNNNTIRKITPFGVVSTLAGRPGSLGSADGTGRAARFSGPFGIAVDGAGNVYVADSFNDTIRKITPSGVVSTLAGSADASGSADGTGSDASFNYPNGVAVDGAGNVYVADSFNSTIRKITPTGVVSTLAGLAGSRGGTDGSGNEARFNTPFGVVLDSAGNLYVAERDNNTIRKITPSGGVVGVALVEVYHLE